MFSLNFPGSGFASVWAQSHQLTDTLSVDFSIFSFFFFLTQNKYCIVFRTLWVVLQYCHEFTATEWRGYVGRHFQWKCVTSGEAVVCHTCRLHRPLLSLQLMGKNKANHFCHVCFVWVFKTWSVSVEPSQYGCSWCWTNSGQLID